MFQHIIFKMQQNQLKRNEACGNSKEISTWKEIFIGRNVLTKQVFENTAHVWFALSIPLVQKIIVNTWLICSLSLPPFLFACWFRSRTPLNARCVPRAPAGGRHLSERGLQQPQSRCIRYKSLQF